MKKLFLLFFSAAALLASGAEFFLKNGQSCEFRFNAPQGKNAILFFSARLKLPAPLESWGVNALKAELNGTPLTIPLNKGDILVDPQSLPQGKYKTLSDGKFFVKGDSDWEIFNAGSGEIYRNVWLLNQPNKTELSNVFYSFAFKLENLKPTGNVLRFKASIPRRLAAYPLEIRDIAVKGFDSRIIFHRDWMQAVYPWSFPALAELGGAEVVKSRNEHGLASFSIHCLEEQDFQIPVLDKDYQIYRLNNSNIPAKLAEAAKRHIPNIGTPYVPELLTPLAQGSTVKLPKGTATFIVRCRKSKPGTYRPENLPVKFTVLDITLPEVDDLPVQNSMYIMGSGSSTQNIYPEFREYGMSMMLMSPWTAPIPLKIVDGKLSADFRNFDAKLKELQSVGLSKRTLFFGTSEPILRNITKLTGENEDGKEFQRRFKEFVTLFFNHADELGMTVYLSLYDEANFQKAVWGKTKTLTAIATSVPNSRMWSTVTELASAAHYYEVLGYRKGRDMCITHPFQTYNRQDDEILKGVLCPDKKISQLRNRFRGEYESITSYPAANNRYAYGIRAWQGNLQYITGFAFWWGNMYKGKENVTPKKCYYVCYPFLEKTTGIRHSSVGWEAIRCGVDDMRYLTRARVLMEKKYGKEKAEAVLNSIFGKPCYNADDFSPSRFAEVRKKLIDIIQECK